MGTAILVFVCLFGVPFAISKLADRVDKKHQERIAKEQEEGGSIEIGSFTAYSTNALKKNETEKNT